MPGNKIQLFEDKRIRMAWDEEDEEWLFSVVDVVGVLTDQPTQRNASTYWAVLKNRLNEEGAKQLLTNCKQLKMTAVARSGGEVAGNARKDIETRTGKPVRDCRRINYYLCVRINSNFTEKGEFDGFRFTFYLYYAYFILHQSLITSENAVDISRLISDVIDSSQDN